MLQDDNCLLGLSDAGAHVSQICDACLPTDLLANWVRERGALSLESAVHKLTGQPAAVFGLGQRGVLRAGGPADVVVFDPDTVSPGPLTRRRDFPADGERVVAAAPRGVVHVLVNGTPIRLDGEPILDIAGTRPGALIRG
jgi:N-acyl-D-aspartate/D-glutamate deacylase